MLINQLDVGRFAARLSFAAPPGVTGVRIVFAPSRTRIRDAVLVACAGPSPGAPIMSDHSSPAFDLMWSSPTTREALLIAQFAYSGEPPRTPSFQFIRPADSFTEEPHDRWARICRKREALITGIPAQEYLYELDRLTNECILRALPAHGGFDEVRWRKLLGLQNYLSRRQCLRFYSPNPSREHPAIIREFAAVADQAFHEAGRKVNHDPARIGATLVEFAAGYHRLRIELDPNDVCTLAGHPDSANIFLFAEFALLCLELDPPLNPQAWEPLFPYLVKANAVFVRRFGPVRPRDLQVYNTVSPGLLPARLMEEINEEYQGIAGLPDLSLKMRQILIAAVRQIEVVEFRE